MMELIYSKHMTSKLPKQQDNAEIHQLTFQNVTPL